MNIRYKHHHQLYSQKFCGIFLTFSFVLLFTSVGFYLASSNAIAIQGNSAHRFEQKVQELNKEWRRLQIEVAELSSPHRLKGQEGEFQAVTSGEILYVTGSGPLALR